MALIYTAKANLAENRLYITMKGSMKVEDVDAYLADFNKEFDKLKPGMTIIFDIRECSAFDPEAAAKMEVNKKRADSKGLGKFAWVVSSVVLKGQMVRSYAGTAFGTIEEAKKYLES